MGRPVAVAAAALLLACACRPADAQRWLPRLEVHGLVGPVRHVETAYAPDPDQTLLGTTSGRGLVVQGELLLRWPLVGIRALETYAPKVEEQSARATNPGFGNREVHLLVGPEGFAGMVGYGQRIMCDESRDFSCWDWKFASLGAASHLPLGGSGMTVDAWARVYTRAREVDVGGKWSGFHFESRLGYRPRLRDVPILLELGYRFEQFSGTPEGDFPSFDEDVSAVFIGLGVYTPSR